MEALILGVTLYPLSQVLTKMYVTLGSLTKHVSLKLINIFRTLRQMKHNLAYVSIKEKNLAKPGTQVALPGIQFAKLRRPRVATP